MLEVSAGWRSIGRSRSRKGAEEGEPFGSSSSGQGPPVGGEYLDGMYACLSKWIVYLPPPACLASLLPSIVFCRLSKLIPWLSHA